MSGYRTWTPGEVITASNVQGYLQDQTVMVFPSDAVRSTAVIVPTEGMLSWLEDSNKYQYYTGATWADLYAPITGGTAGQGLVANGTGVASFGDVSSKFIETTITTKTANHTAVAGDINTVLYFTSSSAVTLTVDDIFPTDGDRIDVIRDGAGTVSIAAGTGITDWAGVGTAGTGIVFNVDIQYAAASVIRVDNGTYRVIGRVSN